MIRNSLLALAATLAVGAAQAATFNFSGVVDAAMTTGVLGQTLSGQFSVADSDIAALIGGSGETSFSALQFSFLGQSYQLSAATDAYVTFDGGLASPNASFATSNGGTIALQSFFGSNNFTYSIGGVDNSGVLAISAVPEPSSWALAIVGLAVIGGVARRRQRVAA